MSLKRHHPRVRQPSAAMSCKQCGACMARLGAAASEGACDCGAVARGAAAHSAWHAQPGFELACSAGDRAGMPAMRRVSRLLWCRPAAARATRQGPGATLDSEDKAWSLVAPRRTGPQMWLS